MDEQLRIILIIIVSVSIFGLLVFDLSIACWFVFRISFMFDFWMILFCRSVLGENNQNLHRDGFSGDSRQRKRLVLRMNQ